MNQLPHPTYEGSEVCEPCLWADQGSGFVPSGTMPRVPSLIVVTLSRKSSTKLWSMTAKGPANSSVDDPPQMSARSRPSSSSASALTGAVGRAAQCQPRIQDSPGPIRTHLRIEGEGRLPFLLPPTPPSSSSALSTGESFAPFLPFFFGKPNSQLAPKPGKSQTILNHSAVESAPRGLIACLALSRQWQCLAIAKKETKKDWRARHNNPLLENQQSRFASINRQR